MLRNDGPRGSKCEFGLVSVRQTILAKVPDCRSEAVPTAGSMVLAPERKSGRQFTLAVFFIVPVFAMACS